MPQDRGKQTPLLESAHKVSRAPGPRAKAVTPQEPKLDLPAGLGEAPGNMGGHGEGWHGAMDLSGVIKAGGRNSGNLCEL